MGGFFTYKQLGGYFTYKRLVSTGCKVAGFQLATSREDFSRSKSKWIKQERRLPGRRERCDRQRAVSLLLLVALGLVRRYSMSRLVSAFYTSH